MRILEDLIRTALVQRDAGQGEQALSSYDRALALSPDNLAVVAGKAELLRRLGRLDEAADWLARAIAVAPDHPQLYDSLGLVLLELGRPADVEKVLRAGVARVPDAVSTLRNLGSFLSDSGRAQDALPWLQRVVELEPGNRDFRISYGIALLRTQAYGTAEAQFRAVLALRPDDPDALNNLGSTLRLQNRLTESEECYRRALSAKPDWPDVLANLGGLLREQGRIGEAKSVFRQALAVRSPWPEVHSNLIFCLDFDGEAGLQEQRAERRRWREAVEHPLSASVGRFPDRPDPGKRLRIGYVSADFNRHSASDMFGAVLMNHDLDRFDIYLYSSGQREDDRTAAFEERSSVFCRVRLLEDRLLADRVREDSVDILVDLSGHSAGNRLPVFARRPAPVQVTAWGYATGTGLSAIDYFLADHRLVPPELHRYFSEQVLDLSCFLSYRPPDYLPEVSDLPAIPAGHVTFGSFNRLAKASDACLALWGDLLLAVPGSRLHLRCKTLDDAGMRAKVLAAFRERGVEADRIDLHGTSTHLDQLFAYHRVDIALDPFPHCGGTTTCEALVMGVPVVSLCGEVPVSRNGLSLLGTMNCVDWVAREQADYLAIARDLAGDLGRLASIRRNLRQLVLACPIGDNFAYTREVEAVYTRLWLRYCMNWSPAD